MDRDQARGLALLDRRLENLVSLAPAEYEVVRRTILATGDLDYRSTLRFSGRSLESGVAALAARTPIVVDGAMVRAGILPRLQETFVNLVHTPSSTSPELGIASLAKRYPDAIFAIGGSSEMLSEILKAIDSGDCRPALAIATPAGFTGVDRLKEKFAASGIPSVYTAGAKGGATVAAAIVNALIDLANEVYR